MNQIVRKLSVSRPVTIGTVVLLGVFEFVALRRNQLQGRQEA
jgi:hypothetical protein